MKAIINSVIEKIGKAGKKYQVIVYNDSLEAIATEGNGDFIPFKGKEIDVEDSKSKDGSTTFFRLPGIESPKKSFTPYPKLSPDLEIRKSSALLALEAIKISGKTLTTENIKAEIKWIENYLRNGFETDQK